MGGGGKEKRRKGEKKSEIHHGGTEGTKEFLFLNRGGAETRREERG
jgi:hypothetical protein